jgi:hypothetical protein
MTRLSCRFLMRTTYLVDGRSFLINIRMMKRVIAYLLILIAIAMIVISFVAKILPPGLTGVGFVLIAYVFLREETG